MTAIRLGAVAYLNAAPLVYSLERQTDRFALRFDVPATCASLLHDRQIDLGLIPSIEYLRRPDYLIVPDIAIASHGPVASVALFSTCPIDRIKSIALDMSSRTSAALLRILCARHFNIAPDFVSASPDLPGMIRRCDAALVIGDTALSANHEALGLEKVDLGEQWTAMTALPFVYAFWAGRPGAIDAEGIDALQAARDLGVENIDAVVAACGGADEEKVRIGRRYLRDNIKYGLGEPERAGLRRFYELARELRLVWRPPDERYF